jgi:hypothetical protein
MAVKIESGVVTSASSRGYGFVRSRSGVYYFAPQLGLREGARVSFVVEPSTKGTLGTAKDVQPATIGREPPGPPSLRLSEDHIAMLLDEMQQHHREP